MCNVKILTDITSRKIWEADYGDVILMILISLTDIQTGDVKGSEW